ncbi:hypothetical protein PybrP1_004768 [[Pythium] brassicae (nom. inval.)]|nr:hypothetical protein PybrP1_004768 [[Pythium] brassicae (nom. inval.)]
MLRSKRQRAGDHGAADDDELARLNPSLMTERQQLAFLLRKTAPASDSAQSSDSSEDELIQNFARGARRIQRPVISSSPRRSAVAHGSGGVDVGSSGEISDVGGENDATQENDSARGNDQQRDECGEKDDSDESQDLRPPPSKKLNVMTAARAAEERRARAAPHRVKKNSPSSSSDVLHMEPFESDGSACGSDFWRLHCALCIAKDGGSRAAQGAAAEALFLCPSCDRKYPTQRALGRV